MKTETIRERAIIKAIRSQGPLSVAEIVSVLSERAIPVCTANVISRLSALYIKGAISRYGTRPKRYQAINIVSSFEVIKPLKSKMHPRAIQLQLQL